MMSRGRQFRLLLSGSEVMYKNKNMILDIPMCL